MADVNVYDDITLQDYSNQTTFLIRAYDELDVSDYSDSFQRFAIMSERWLFPVKERLIFSTEILQSHNRTEQRISKRLGIPERHLIVRVLLGTDNCMSRYETLIHSWLKKQWAIPLWPLAEYTTDSITAGQATITVDTTYTGYKVGGYALLWQDKDTYDVVTISSVNDSELNLNVTPDNTYNATTFIMPIRTGYCLSTSRLRRYHGMAYVDITFRIMDVEDVIDYVPDMSYDGYVVLDTPSKFFRDGMDYTYDPDLAVMDAGTGPFDVITNSIYNISLQPYTWICETKQSAWNLRQFLYHIKGMQKGFLVPSFGYDIELSQDVGVGDTDIYVVNNDYYQNMGLSDMRTYIAFRPVGSDIIVRRITGINVLSDSEEIITIDSATGDTFSAGDYLCWVDLCRLASDDVTMNWYQRGKCYLETNLLRIETYVESILEPYGHDGIVVSEGSSHSIDMGTYAYDSLTVSDETDNTVV